MTEILIEYQNPYAEDGILIDTDLFFAVMVTLLRQRLVPLYRARAPYRTGALKRSIDVRRLSRGRIGLGAGVLNRKVFYTHFNQAYSDFQVIQFFKVLPDTFTTAIFMSLRLGAEVRKS